MKPVTVKARIFAALGTAIFLLVAPGTFAVAIPWWISRWHVHASFPGFTAIRIAGALLITAAAVFVMETFLRFALQGIGTPAPIAPTMRLVVTGSYRYVRNPMYIAVVSLVLGQGLLFGNAGVLMYGLCAWLATHLFVVFYEEPTLQRSFPDDYRTFSAHVPRWLPRLTPWNGHGA
ncbi:MAG TPA: isoprenylcysteine carboxylmethyltransferase family protein [Terracidiphilus sp.]